MNKAMVKSLKALDLTVLFLNMGDRHTQIHFIIHTHVLNTYCTYL